MTTSRFRDMHTRTYEIELLISGALVFGLFQVPGAIEHAFDAWMPRFDGLATAVASYLFLYALMIAYSLLGMFILHLAMRGYWVALLGVESVWPEGWDWTKLKFGPYSRPYMEAHVPTLAVTIDRADDRASVVFAAGTLLAMVFLYSLLLSLMALPIGWGVSTISGGRIDGMTAFFWVLGLLFAPLMLVPMVDRLAGHRISRTSAAGRLLDTMVRGVMRVSVSRITAPVQFVFQGHMGEKPLAFAMAGAGVALSILMIGGMLWRAGELRVDGWTRYSTDAGAVGFEPAQYRDSGASRSGTAPSIDSDIIRGPYLRVYLPYRPRRHNPLLDKTCPLMGPVVDQMPASAACLGDLHRLLLDDQPLQGLTFDFTRDAGSDFVGVITFIDVRTLGPGRHVLQVDAPGRDEGTTTTYRIPFYRE